jgi:PAS domain S-box-containing protein
VDVATLWRALCDDPYVWVVNADGIIRFVNENGAQFYLGVAAEEVVGKRLGEVFPETFTRERMEVVRRTLETASSVRFSTHWGGQWLRARVWPMESPEAAVLVVVRPCFDECAGADESLLELLERDGRPLGALSPTGRLVLAGIGEGWSTAEIARRMHRSVKTVEWHRGALGKRLGCANRVALARLALLAGLSWERARALCGGDEDEEEGGEDGSGGCDPFEG